MPFNFHEIIIDRVLRNKMVKYGVFNFVVLFHFPDGLYVTVFYVMIFLLMSESIEKILKNS